MKWGLIIMRLALFALAVIKGIFIIEEIKNAVDLECLQVWNKLDLSFEVELISQFCC